MAKHFNFDPQDLQDLSLMACAIKYGCSVPTVSMARYTQGLNKGHKNVSKSSFDFSDEDLENLELTAFQLAVKYGCSIPTAQAARKRFQIAQESRTK